MRKLLTIFAALMLGVGLWAETRSVSYRYPVYNISGDSTSGVKKWQTATVYALVVESSSDRVSWSDEWYVVTGNNVQLSKGVECTGTVRLILADGAKLTVTGESNQAGIEVFGSKSHLIIYGQSASSGQLIANGVDDTEGIGSTNRANTITINGGTITATGGSNAVGIGSDGACTITINGGTITATGGSNAVGIGSKSFMDCANVIINGGTITATGGTDIAAGIGNGYLQNTVSNITVATSLIVKADGNNPPTMIIPNDGTNIAAMLAGRQYVYIETDPLLNNKNTAIAAVNAAISGIDNDNIKAIATSMCGIIRASTTTVEIDFFKTRAINNINSAKAVYTDGKADGKAEAQAELPTEGTAGPAVVITKGDKSVTLINPDDVKYTIVEE